ncbi:MAG: AAA family ATPase [Bryobacterales bacterium]|nr:AAA family ATPase [Bryobacterales bacterium]
MPLDAGPVKEHVDIARVIGEYVPLKKGGPRELVGLCPFHKEKTPSFTVTPDKRMFYCFGCQAGGDVFDFVAKIEGVTFNSAVRKVAEMVGLDPESYGQAAGSLAVVSGEVPSRPVAKPTSNGTPKVVATYPYIDEHGELLYEVQRIEPGRNGKAKDFRQRRVHPIDGAWVWGISDGAYHKGQNGDWYPVKGEAGPDDDELPEVRRVLYRLPQVLAAETVYVVEGEKDVHTLEAAGLVATTNSGGAAQKWLPQYTEVLRGRRVIVIPDKDEPGKKRGAAILKDLEGKADAILIEVPTGKDVTDFVQSGGSIDDLQALVVDAVAKRTTLELDRRGLLSPIEIIEQFEGGPTAFLDPSKRAPGLRTGFLRLDDMTLGFHPGELIILAARPSQGKTALALNIASNVAERNHTVAIFSLEMSRESLLTRFVCSRARVDQMKFRSGYLSADQHKALARAFHDTCALPIFIDDKADANIESIRRKLAILRSMHGLSLVVIDYLQLMNSGKKENRTQEVSALSRGLKIMAREFSVPFLVLSQLSRAPEQRLGNHRPQLSDLRESGGIEQDADVVAFIFREEVYKPDNPDLRGVADLIIAKQRNGPVGAIKLTFIHHLTRFENATTSTE